MSPAVSQSSRPIASSLPSHTHILIVEDRHSVAITLQRGLNHILQINSTVVYSAEDALCKLPQHPTQLVITDYSLPGMNGLMLADLLHQQQPTLPIIMLTAHDSLQNQQQLPHISELLIKPVSLFDLAHVVNRLLDSQ